MSSRLKQLSIAGVVLLLIVAVAVVVMVSRMNRYQQDGTLTLDGLQEPVTVLRDENGMATIQAQNMDDLLFAQGFVTAQDRLFQMELSKLFSEGRIGELAGERAEALDVRARTIGFHRHARRQAELLSPTSRRFMQRYVDGVNAYILTRSDTHHLEFKLAGIQPEPWEIEDSLALAFYMSWLSAANLDTEIVAQMLFERLGPERALEIFPLIVNPDDEPADGHGSLRLDPIDIEFAHLDLRSGPRDAQLPGAPLLGMGSNNWVTGGGLSASGKPILANDTHQDSRMLPGPWYPTGLVTPEHRSVGATVPGIPGMVLGRNEYVTYGVTNAYGDAQDLYVETVDPANPDHYLEGEISVPFEVLEETLRFKDDEAPEGFTDKTIEVRLTHRGPVVSEVLPGLDTDEVLTLRWAPFESMGPELGLDKLLAARSSADVRRALADLDILMLNFVFADTEGHFGWAVSGRLPIRERGNGTVPLPVIDGSDDWVGWIPFVDNPHDLDPERGWVGTCNHSAIPQGYPYYYSSHLSPSWRYRRLSQLLDAPGPKTAADHWAFQRDTRNPMAERIAPIMALALLTEDDTVTMARLLGEWDHEDRPDLAAPLVFQAVYGRFAYLVFADELGEDLATVMLSNWYFWQERLAAMVSDGESSWFDDVTTVGEVEGLVDLFVRAAREVASELGAEFGADPTTWRWGDAHRLEFVSPIRRDGLGKGILGGGSHAMPGSGETLHRGLYDFDEPYMVKVSASVRMVVDLADDEKVMAVLPGGVTGRHLSPHYTDQIDAYINGDEMFWWFGEEAVAAHARSRLVLVPESP